ncbi:MAG: hypothetical protein JWP31_973 [Aeromicrobium sp.]|nr:hypothetical protein [Aeromicrobium sp.]
METSSASFAAGELPPGRVIANYIATLADRSWVEPGVKVLAEHGVTIALSTYSSAVPVDSTTDAEVEVDEAYSADELHALWLAKTAGATATAIASSGMPRGVPATTVGVVTWLG